MLQDALLDSLRLFRQHYAEIGFIVIPIYLPAEILSTFFAKHFSGGTSVVSAQLPSILIHGLAEPVCAAGVVFYISALMAGDTLETRVSWKLGLKHWLPYVLLGIIVEVAVYVGLLLLIVPGIVLLARLAFADFALLLEKRNLIDALNDSWDTTKNHAWTILAGFLLITVVLYGPVLGYAAMLYGHETLPAPPETQALAESILGGLLGVLYSVLDTLYLIFVFCVYRRAKSVHDRALQVPSRNGTAQFKL